MPIRPELRKFYGREWREVIRPRILARAGNKCEQCGKPAGKRIETLTGVLTGRGGRPYHFMAWRVFGTDFWRDQNGRYLSSHTFPFWDETGRNIRGQVGVAHMNHVPGDDRDENLKALCNWCHLMHDRGKHKETRAARKDAARPLLQLVS